VKLVKKGPELERNPNPTRATNTNQHPDEGQWADTRWCFWMV